MTLLELIAMMMLAITTATPATPTPVGPVDPVPDYNHRVDLTAEVVWELVSHYDDWDHAKAVCIAFRESRFRPWVVSDTDDHGLFQLNRPTWSSYFGDEWSRVYSPKSNVEMAHEVWLQGGWWPWTTNDGSCG
jgi:hypothetical protein